MSYGSKCLAYLSLVTQYLPASGYQVQRDQLPVTITYIASNALAVA